MTDATPQAALLSEASKLSNEFQPTMHIDVLISWGNDAVAELRRLDALVAHLTADRDDTANELALRTKHNIALTNERDQLLAKLQATQEPVQAVPEAMKVVTEAMRSDPDYAWSWHCNVAMASVDEGMGYYEANQAAARFMRLLAGVDTTKHQGFPEAPKKEPVQAGELPAFEQWWRQRQLLTFPKDYDQSRLADWGAAYKPAAKDAWQARAALSARKPLTDETFVAACNGCPTPGKCKDTSGCASAGMNVPTYYVRHPDDTYTAADPQPRFNGIGLEVKP